MIKRNMINPITQILNGDILNGILNILVILVVLYFGLKFIHATIQNIFIIHQNKKMVYLKVRLPRSDSAKDDQKKNEKDFKEKVSIMEQFYRNIHELSELSLKNRIITTIFSNNIVSFDLVAQNQKIDFYLVVPLQYQNLLEKQITTYYPDADINPTEKYNFGKKGYALKMYFAYMVQGFWKPFKTYKALESDPLNEMINIFSKLNEHEAAGLQVTLRPIKKRKYNKKAQKYSELLHKGKDVPKINFPGGKLLYNLWHGIMGNYDKMTSNAEDVTMVRMLNAKEEATKLMGQKAGQPLFRAVIRFWGAAENYDRATRITDNVNLALNMYKDDYLNWFQTQRVVFIDKLNTKIMKFFFIHRLIDTGFWFLGEEDIILGPSELASLFHLPDSKYNKSSIINWLAYKVLPAPVDLPEEGVLLGNNVYRGDKREVRILPKDRTRHQYCIGKSGAGKSAFLSFMARQDIWNGSGVGLIDPHGDLAEELTTFVPKERAKDVIVFDPADSERPMGLNILEADSPEEMDMASSQATEIFIKLFGDEIFGPRIQHYFRNACLTLMEDKEEGATLIDVPRVFTDDEFMKYKVSKTQNPVVRSFWEHEYANTGDRERQEMIPYFSSKFGPFITNSIMRNTIGQPKSAFNIRHAMDKQQILLMNLSKGKIGGLNTQLLGLVLVARVQMAAMSRVDLPEEDRKPFYLYVDEFQNFSTDSFCSILSEARKYKLALIMAHQYIKQLEKKGDTSIRDAVFGNVGTMMSFKIGAEDAEYMSKEYAPLLSEQDILGIANYKAYIKLNIKNTTSRPFSLETIWDMSKSNKKVGKIIKEYSRIKYGRKREFVDQEIKARIGIDSNNA